MVSRCEMIWNIRGNAKVSAIEGWLTKSNIFNMVDMQTEEGMKVVAIATENTDR